MEQRVHLWPVKLDFLPCSCNKADMDEAFLHDDAAKMEATIV